MFEIFKYSKTFSFSLIDKLLIWWEQDLNLQGDEVSTDLQSAILPLEIPHPMPERGFEPRPLMLQIKALPIELSRLYFVLCYEMKQNRKTAK